MKKSFILVILLSFFIFLGYAKNALAVSFCDITEMADGSYLLSGKTEWDQATITDLSTIKVSNQGDAKIISAVDSSGKKVSCNVQTGTVKEELSWLQSFANRITDIAWGEAASKAYGSVLSSALNKIAYDTAKWLGSGGTGQKPLFVTESWESYLSNIADEAAGQFISEVMSSVTSYGVCQPDQLVMVKIGLGLRNISRPQSPKCSFSTMLKNWDSYLNSNDFMNNLSDMFEPTSNDVAISLSLTTKMLDKVAEKKEISKTELAAKKGWLDVRTITGKLMGTPEEAVSRKTQAEQSILSNMANSTGNAFVDAVNTFLNTLLLELFNTMMSQLGSSSSDTSSEYSGDYGLSDAESGSSSSSSSDSDSTGTSGSGSGVYSYESSVYSGIAGAEKFLRDLSEPKFNTKGDYEVLGDLSSCPDPSKPNTSNCVIDDKFKQAIMEKVTLAQAIDKDYINPNVTFGFTSDGLEPAYNEGIPYRSIVILRKYRIIPVGWELAAEYLKDKTKNNTTNTANSSRNLQYLMNCFSKYDNYGSETDWEEWCDGLIDPNWVLKAPQNYCRRSGPGPDIVSEQIAGSDDNSVTMLTRDENYCADEQSCIKEKSDGSCDLYGYCTEERRKWDFSSTSCEPRYNTCQTFRSRTGQTASYLENTVDFANCSSENVGCGLFAASGSYSAASNTLAWNGGSNALYFDRDRETCSSQQEGCHEFIRMKDRIGANYLINSSFEEDLNTSGGWQSYGIASTTGYEGGRSLQLSGTLTKTVTVGPSDFNVGGHYYTLSFYARNCASGDWYALGADADLASDEFADAHKQYLQPSDNWVKYQVSYAFAEDVLDNEVSFTIVSNSCIIDAVKLESGNEETDYSAYADMGKVYEKLAPAYLNCTGASTDPSACSDFARTCSRSELGCEMYTRKSDDFSVPAKVSAQDYCPEECLGYDTYIQSATVFDTLRDSYFIPSSAQTCSAEGAGCDQFTNLDKVGAGAEEKEYYSYLRQCVKPSAATSTYSCADFYTWEGSDESGYQLKVFSLKGAVNSGRLEPDVTDDDLSGCTETIYNLDPANPAYNADCRQFYNQDGQTAYRLYKNTISCSENCHPYRRTAVNTDPAITSADQCSGTDKHWDAVNEECAVCKSKGRWDDQHQSCIYEAIPEEGTVCAAEANGCREYKGNTGANTKLIVNSDFDGSKQDWRGDGDTEVDLSSEALTVGGNSLLVKNGSHSAYVSIAGSAESGKSYVLSFLAKSVSSGNLSWIGIANSSTSTAEAAQFGSVSLDNTWKIYTLNLSRLDHSVDDSERLIFTGTGDFYLDQVRLTEIKDVYYLIKDSWKTPASCDRDIYDQPYPLYMLGCYQYEDRDKNTHNLHSFTSLCSESGVGCELVIDTENSTAIGSTTVSGVTTPADHFSYVVYDQDKACLSQEKGCQRLGQRTYYYSGHSIYADVYVRNDPDEYAASLCSASDVGCEEWSTGSGYDYFKDPGDMLCEWRQSKSSTTPSNWYKTKVNRCDTNSDGAGDGAICRTASDCSGGQACKQENNDVLCPTSNLLTFGYGGQGNRVDQPARDVFNYCDTNNDGVGDGTVCSSDSNCGAGGKCVITSDDYNQWTGLCPASDSGCTEYIDPLSKFNSNVIFNADFADIDKDGNYFDGWSQDGSNYSQEVKLETYALYRIAASGGSTNIELACNDDFYQLLGANELGQAITRLTFSSVPSQVRSHSFYTNGNSRCYVKVNNAESKIEIKEAAVDYQNQEKVDKSTCNGIVDFEKGCVLFNEREKSGSNWADLNYDADATYEDADGKSPNNCSGSGTESNCDSNSIIKVSPDRICDKWLGCRTYVKGQDGSNSCFNIGLCDSVDDNGYCNNFLLQDQTNQKFSNHLGSASGYLHSGEVANYSGYNKVGYYDNAGTSMSLGNDYFPFGTMKQKGGVADIPNGSFEDAGDNSYPIGWEKSTQYKSAMTREWSEYFEVVDNPVAIQQEGIKRNPDGNKFLKLGPGYAIESEQIDVIADSTYVLSAYINTINLLAGAAYIGIIEYPAGSVSGSTAKAQIIKLEPGKDWTYKYSVFTLGASTAKIQVIISTDNNEGVAPVRTAYYDAVKIRPALQSKNNSYSAQSCRLYPQKDSLSCNYFDDAGKKQKGWIGYCLEYDRAPGNPDACLTWWPIDKAEGEGIEEGAGYTDKYPVYYCLYAKPYCEKGDNTDSFGFYCQDIVQTVTTSGSNKYWAGRTFPTSDYVVPLDTISNKYIKWLWIEKELYYQRLHCEDCNDADDCDTCNDDAEDVDVEGTTINGKEWAQVVYEENTGEDGEGENRVWCYPKEEGGGGSCENGACPVESMASDYCFDKHCHDDFDGVSYFCDDDELGGVCGDHPRYATYNANNGTSYADAHDLMRNLCRQNLYNGTVNNYAYEGGEGEEGGTTLQARWMTDSEKEKETKRKEWLTDPVLMNYTEDHQPFGSIYTPKPSNNPVEWTENSEQTGYIPLFVARSESERGSNARAGTPYFGFGTEGGSAVEGSDECTYDYKDPTITAGGSAEEGDLGEDTTLSKTFNQGNCDNSCSCDTSTDYGKASADQGNVCGNSDAGGGSSCSVVDLGEWNSCSGTATGEGDYSVYNAPGNSGRWYMYMKDDCSDDPSYYVDVSCSKTGTPSAGDPGSADKKTRYVRERHLYYEVSSSEDEAKYGAQRIFAQTYGAWSWNGTHSSGNYQMNSYWTWNPPKTLCGRGNNDSESNNYLGSPTVYDRRSNNNAYNTKPGDWCSIPPRISDIYVEGKSNDDVILEDNSQFINFTFLSHVDMHQLPLTMYAVDWGDGEVTTVSGVEMRDRQDVNDPHSLYHLYGYWDLRTKWSGSTDRDGAYKRYYEENGKHEIMCADNCQNLSGDITVSRLNGYSGACCAIKPRAKIKDNWGWCSWRDGYTGLAKINICDTYSTDKRENYNWEPFAKWVIVKEK